MFFYLVLALALLGLALALLSVRRKDRRMARLALIVMLPANFLIACLYTMFGFFWTAEWISHPVPRSPLEAGVLAFTVCADAGIIVAGAAMVAALFPRIGFSLRGLHLLAWLPLAWTILVWFFRWGLSSAGITGFV